MIFSIVTIFPSLIESCLQSGIVARARHEGIVEIEPIDLRSFTHDKHRTTDDRPFGGGEGMVMTPAPLSLAIRRTVREQVQNRRVILLSPQGRKFCQETAVELRRQQQLILICGRYEGVDERFREKYVDEEISVGDFILSGGELPALMVVDAVTRLLPGVLGCADSAANDTFSRYLLKHPQYTRPRIFEEMEVPKVLFSGNHNRIEEFRFIESVKRTIERRPDLLKKAVAGFTDKEKRLLEDYGLDVGAD
ncbi:MAG: tRNA (guanosine(37)-N1)-methyltransferase TrmD [Desulfofustis sp.]|nr:tRNA (guanosine(37)-N1)-methyltransferase TrmD [Desulfofustis sp.]